MNSRFALFLLVCCICGVTFYLLIQNLASKPNVSPFFNGKTVAIKVIADKRHSIKAMLGNSYVISQKLKFISGCELESELSYFGGWSGMTFIEGSLLLVSDLSAWLLIADPLNICEKKAVTGTIGWLFNSEKRSLRVAGYGDIEAVSYSKEHNQLLLSHESYSSGIFQGSFQQDNVSEVPFKLLPKVPKTLHNLPKGRGLEGISWVRDMDNQQLILAVAERNPKQDEDSVPGWILDSDAVLVKELKLTVDHGFDVSDIAYAENCGLFILERKLSWFGKFFVKLKRVDLDGFLVNNEWQSETIFTGDSSGSLIDNMEGISVSYTGNECKIAMVADSNFIKLQKTTFLLFSYSIH